MNELKKAHRAITIGMFFALILGFFVGRLTAPTQQDIDLYFLSKAKDVCKENGGEWFVHTERNGVEMELNKMGLTLNGDSCVINGKGPNWGKTYFYKDHRLIHREPEKVEYLDETN